MEVDKHQSVDRTGYFLDSLITCKSLKLVDDISNQLKVAGPWLGSPRRTELITTLENVSAVIQYIVLEKMFALTRKNLII